LGPHHRIITTLTHYHTMAWPIINILLAAAVLYLAFAAGALPI
jgi:hypothetical protein